MQRHYWVFVAILVLLETGSAFYYRSQFQDWYQGSYLIFSTIRDQNCTAEFILYKTGNKSVPVDHLTGGGKTNKLAQPLANCLLENASEFVKSNMASAQVLLGLTPSILSMLGPSIDEVAILGVIGRRWWLAALITIGSPVALPRRTLEQNKPSEILEGYDGRLRPSSGVFGHGFMARGKILFIIESLLMLTSIANLIIVAEELSRRTIVNFAPHLPILVPIWTFMVFLAYVPGYIAMSLRISKVPERKTSRQYGIVSPELVSQPYRIKLHPETFKYITLSYMASFFVIGHVIFGTLTWSSLLFLNVRDGTYVILRYMLSQMLGRTVLMIELAALHDSYIGEVQESNTRINQVGEYQGLGNMGEGFEDKGDLSTLIPLRTRTNTDRSVSSDHMGGEITYRR